MMGVPDMEQVVDCLARSLARRFGTPSTSWAEIRDGSLRVSRDRLVRDDWRVDLSLADG